MIVDAVVLAGGRASRLGGSPKPRMRYNGGTLLEAAIEAVSTARQTVVVGDLAEIAAAAPGAHITVAREDPAFGGPAAGIAAGLERLADNGLPSSDFTLTIACDMPRIAEVVAVLLAALRADSDGVVAVSPDGRRQLLAGVYSTALLGRSVAEHRTNASLSGLSVRALLFALTPDSVETEEGVTDDVDTWADAERLGVLAAVPFSI